MTATDEQADTHGDDTLQVITLWLT